MARSHVESFLLARKIKKIQVYSPTKENRDAYAKEISEKYGLEVTPVDGPPTRTRARILSRVVPTLRCRSYTASGWKKARTSRVSAANPTTKRWTGSTFRCVGNAPHPWELPDFGLADEYITYAAKPHENADFQMKRAGERGHGVIAEDRAIFLEELLSGKKKGRTSDRQITYSERGNIQGAQFFAVAGKVYELAKAKGLGREIPTEWLLQDIRD